MTQEEKAKAYDEALKRARARYDKEPTDGYVGYTNQILEEIFPQIKDSEDERIRKALIWHLKAGEDFVSNEVTKEQTIAWLEKQKDASKAIEAVDRIDKYIDEHLANAHDMKDSDPDKKYYRGWDDALGEMAGILQDVYSEEKQKENPKSADSIPSDCMSDAKCEDRWHKVADSLPDNPREVLCKDAAGNYFIGRYYVGEGWEISNYDDEDKPHHLNPPVSKWIDFPSEKQKEQNPSEDLEKVVMIDNVIMNMTAEGYNNGYKTRPFYEEVLRRFREERK